MGLWGNSDFGGIGVFGGGGIGVQASGSRAALQLLPSGAAPRSRGDAHTRGEVVHDTNGDVWVCVSAGSPGTWRKLAGPSASGAFHVLELGCAGLRLANERREARQRRSAHHHPDRGPVRLVGRHGQCDRHRHDGRGLPRPLQGGIAYPGNSNLNWYATGQTLAVTTVSAVSDVSRLVVRAGGGGSTHVIVDVIGYHS